MKAYASLTVRGQAHRLRQLAWRALEQYTLDVVGLRLVTNDLNGIFRVDTRPGGKYILRISLPRKECQRDSVTAEMDWLAALRRDTVLSVTAPVPARDGRLFVESAAPGVPEARLCAIFSWAPGTDLARHLTVENAQKLGALCASLHQHAQNYRPPAGLRLLSHDRVFPFPEPVILFEDRYAAWFPPARRRIFEQAIAAWQAAIDRLQASGESMRLLHNDLHQWNIRIYRGKLTPIDFEDLMLGWPVQDVAISFYYIFDRPDYPELRQAFQAGYCQVSPWPERYPGEIEALIAGRGMDLVNFILQDPNPEWANRAQEFIEKTESRLRRLLPAIG